MKILFYTGFIASVFAFIGFFFLEFLYPGFVMPFFSVYLFGLTALVFGSLSWHEHLFEQSIAFLLKCFLSLLLVMLFLREGAFSDNLRIVLACIAGITPWLFTKNNIV